MPVSLLEYVCEQQAIYEDAVPKMCDTGEMEISEGSDNCRDQESSYQHVQDTWLLFEMVSRLPRPELGDSMFPNCERWFFLHFLN